jgi:hypothetical protein
MQSPGMADEYVTDLQRKKVATRPTVGLVTVGFEIPEAWARSVNSRHPNVAPIALFTSTQCPGANCPARLLRDTRETILRLSQVPTQTLGKPQVLAGPPTRSRTTSFLPFFRKFPGFRTFDGIRLSLIRFAHLLCLVPEDRILDGPPDKVGSLPFCRRSNPINCFLGCFIEMDEDLQSSRSR